MTEQRKIKLGVIGCGAIAELYHLPALDANIQTCGQSILVDTNRARLDKLQEQFQVASVTTDFRELLGQVDGVIVATPPTSHFAISKWFLEHGVHVLCEKPLTESAAEARELVEIAAHNQVQLAVNQTRRFFPTYRKIRELIEAGTFGELKSIKYHDGVEFDWPAASPHHFAPGARGAWSDTGVHLLDTVCYWLNARPKIVKSETDSFGGPEALTTVCLQHDGCEIEIKVSRLGRLQNGFEITGTRASLQADAEEWAVLTLEHEGGRKQRIKCGSRSQKYNDFAHPLLADFVAAIEDSQPVAVSGASTLSTIELLEEAYDSSSRYAMHWNDARHLAQLSLAVQEQIPPRVLVTGASGFLGGRVVELMHLSGLATPVAAIRNWSRAARVARFPIEIAICDIQDAAQVDAAVRGVDAVVHCAKTDDRESIVGGTRILLDAARRHGVEKFVHLSTAEVYGPDVTGEISESHELPKTGRLYGDAKIEAEQLCHEYDDLCISILRPSLIYGPFSTSWSIDVAKRLQSGNWGTYEELGEGNANLVYVDDLVQAILRSLDASHHGVEAFNVMGPDQLTWNQYFEWFNQALGLPELQSISPNKSRLKTRAMDAVDFVADKILDRFEDKLMEIYLRGGLASRVMKRIKGELSSTPSGIELNDLFNRRAVYSDRKARELLNYEPQIDIRQGLQLTTQWLRLHELTMPANHPAENQQTGSGEGFEVSDKELVS